MLHYYVYPHREECMHEMDSSTPGAPTVMVVDAGDVFVGGRYHSLVPILRFGFLVLNHGVHVIPALKKTKLLTDILMIGKNTRVAETSTTRWL